MSEDITN